MSNKAFQKCYWLNMLILQKVKDLKARLFYLHATIKNGWRRV